MPRSVILLLAGLVSATGLLAQAPKLEIPQPSPAATIKQVVGVTNFELNYSRPAMRGRKIFGGLVPYDEVWRTGANSATTLSFSTPVSFAGTVVPAGKYELFTIPGKSDWTFIIHQDKSEWGAYSYDPKNDVARVHATATTLAQPVESFAIEFTDLTDESGMITLSWENTRVAVPFSIDTVGMVVPQIEAVMSSNAEKKPYVGAAMFYLAHKHDLNQALAWMDEAVKAEPNAFYYVYRKALVQEALGDKAGAAATATASKETAQKAGGAVGAEYVHLNDELLARLKG